MELIQGAPRPIRPSLSRPRHLPGGFLGSSSRLYLHIIPESILVRTSLYQELCLCRPPHDVGTLDQGQRFVQMTAWGSFARDVPKRNLHSLSFVSWEKEYKRDSEAWSCCHVVSKRHSPFADAGQLTMTRMSETASVLVQKLPNDNLNTINRKENANV